MSVADDPRAGLGKTPIPGDAPAGINVAYEESFDALQTEVSKMEADGPTAVRWKEVIRMATAILENESKDLKVAAYLTFGLYREEGYKGLALGLTIVKDMIDSFWEGLWPPQKRERARCGSVDWIAERIGPTAQNEPPKPDDAEAVIAAYAAIDAIDQLLSEKLTKESPALTDLLRPLRGYAQEAERNKQEAEEKAKKAAEAAAAKEAAAEAGDGEAAPEGDAAPAASAPATPAPAAPSAPAPAPAAAAPVSAPGVSSANLDKSVGDIGRAMRDLANALRAANPADARAYELLRQAVWLPVKRLPPADGGKTMLPEVPPDEIKAITSLLQSGDYRTVINRAEPMIVGAPFWFGAHRLVASAMKQLGGEFAGAHAAVCGTTGTFIKRFPDVVDLSFQTGSPFVDEQTKAWLDGEVLAGPGGGGGGAGQPWNDALGEARQLAMGGKVKDGAALFATGRRSAAGGRERCLWDLAQARYCLEANALAAALPIAEALDAEVAAENLENFDPSLTADAAELLLRCYNHQDIEKLRTPEESRAARAGAEARLCRLDVATAISLMKS